MGEPVPISALQHYLYCPRQCALIHVEQSYSENVYTLRGNRLHEKAHDAGTQMLAGVRLERALPLYSDSLGLVGKADIVEFLVDGTPYPVEYKAGARKKRQADDVQLCAQAMCLEEMLERKVPEGSIYYDRSRRRRIVEFGDGLRQTVLNTVCVVRVLLAGVTLPEPVADERCRACSLIESCMPAEVSRWRAWAYDPFMITDAP